MLMDLVLLVFSHTDPSLLAAGVLAEIKIPFLHVSLLSNNILLSFCAHSVATDSPTLWTVAHQVSLSMGFFRQEYWSGLQFCTPALLKFPFKCHKSLTLLPQLTLYADIRVVRGCSGRNLGEMGLKRCSKEMKKRRVMIWWKLVQMGSFGDNSKVRASS